MHFPTLSILCFFPAILCSVCVCWNVCHDINCLKITQLKKDFEDEKNRDEFKKNEPFKSFAVKYSEVK